MAETAVKQLLNDPDSAQFTQVTTNRANGSTCGFVNAKNRMGGFVGATPFYFDEPMKSAAIISPPTHSDFRSLWLGIQTNDFSEKLGELRQRCVAAGRWKDVCGTDYPGYIPALCVDLARDGTGLYQKLKQEFAS